MGQVIIFKGADFSDNAISDDVVYDKIIEQTNGTPGSVGISSYFPINKPFTHDCIITALSVKKQSTDSKFFTALGVRTLGDGLGNNALIRFVTLPLLEDTDDFQLVSLPQPLEVHAGEYLCIANKGTIPNYPDGAANCDVVYTAIEDAVETECALLKIADFSAGTITVAKSSNKTYFFIGTIYGYEI